MLVAPVRIRMMTSQYQASWGRESRRSIRERMPASTARTSSPLPEPKAAFVCVEIAEVRAEYARECNTRPIARVHRGQVNMLHFRNCPQKNRHSPLVDKGKSGTSWQHYNPFASGTGLGAIAGKAAWPGDRAT